MKYRQLASEERYLISAFRIEGFNQAQIAARLGRAPSTVCRELARNHCPADGRYRPSKAHDRARWRRSRARRNQRFGAPDLALVERWLREDWSPEQVAGRLGEDGVLSISHETIYRHVWADKRRGGDLFRHLRGAQKQRRKRYGAYDSRGRLAGKRSLAERPACVETRQQLGHWEIDTVMGAGAQDCIVTAVERKTGYAVIGKLPERTTDALNRRAQPTHDPADPPPRRLLSHDHRRQRHGVSCVREDRGGDRSSLLLRGPLPLVGARQQREPQRPGPPVPTQASQHGRPHPAALQRNRPQAQPKATKETGIQDPGGVLLWLRTSVALQT